ncbi:methyl-accepting chemotaxis protein [Aliikangiella sp. IMCC44359]|uniref:methyl-accepting chemotaxis protein n=1 Tax=Aliikangiella sp. IMCC44359 TaxID=3459125 RepID=UPI00403AA34D
MNLTVTTRLVGGSGLVILLLIALSFTALNGIGSVEKSLTKISEESTPMLIAGSENLSSLLKATVEVNRFHQAKNSNELQKYESNYQKWMKVNKESAKSLLDVAKNHSDVLNSLKESDKSEVKFAQLAPQIFASHRQDLLLGETIENQRKEFESLADELDSYLYDFADNIEVAQISKQLQTVSNTAREVSVLVIDTLLIDNIAKIELANKNVEALEKEFQKQFELITANQIAVNNSFYNATVTAIQKFKKLIVGENNLLSIYQRQLLIRDKSNKLLAEADESAKQAQHHINNLFTKVKTLTDTTTRSAVDKVNASRTWLLGFAMLTILTAIGINYWGLKSITRPLNDVLGVINKASGGDLTQKAHVYSDDELGKLSVGLNNLIDALRNMLKDIGSSAQQLSASAEETTMISSQSNQDIVHQKEQTDMIATAMTEMTATVGDVANSANNALVEVQRANREAADGQKVVEENIKTINQLANEIESAAVVIDRLEQYSTNIGAVLDVIRGIADQTNLLALNAAIEAARAGEQGRGFAVVADEVRTLASKTQESTSEIQEMIERLQSGTREAVAVMESSREEASNSVGQTARAGESLGKITQAVNVINDMSTHIASAAEEQSSVSQEMHQNIEAISDMADRTSTGAGENLAASQELARLAEHLKELVERFKF